MGALSARRIVGAGTPEAQWCAWWSLHPMVQADVGDLVTEGRCLHVVAPHPDDEVLGCAGIMRQALRMGSAVHVWAVTDGEASHASSPAMTQSKMAEVRTRESERALRQLGPGIQRRRLGIPDGEIVRYRPMLEAVLIDAIAFGDTVITPWILDGHPDHEAVAEAGREAARMRRCRLFEVPIWGWHWADPRRGEFPADNALAIALTDADSLAKARAIRAFRSQLHPDPATGRPPILPDFVLARFQRPFEVVLR